MKKLTVCVLLLAGLAMMGCKSKTGRQNIQYVRPAQDSMTFDDLSEEEDTGYVIMEEDSGIEVGELPSEEDFERLRSEQTKKEMEQILMGQ